MPPLKPAGASARKSRRRAPPRKTARSRAKPARRKTAPARKSTPRRRTLVIRRHAPLRQDDPSARKTGRRRNYYTPEFLAEAKRRIETTLQSTTSIALDLGTDRTNLWRLVRSEGWVRPEGSLRLRGLSPAMRLAMQADGLVSGAVSTPTPTLPLAGGGSPTESAAPPSPDMIERLESAVIRELAIVERMRASMRDEPLRPMDAERTARTLSVLTETLAKLRRLRLGSAPQSGSADNDNDMPADIDAFRHALAHRIEAFLESREADGDADSAAGAVVVDEPG
jgi:hypothetical protein